MKHLGWLALVILCSWHARSQDQPSPADLVRGLQCTTCHTCDVPTRENPCVRECPRIHMVTVHQDPGQGPDFLILDSTRGEEDLYEPVRFSHKWHAEMSGMAGGCTVCHHYNPPGGILACRECHEAARLRTALGKPDLRGAYHRQCVGCHREWAHEVGCQSCHAAKGRDTLQRPAQGEASLQGARHPVVEIPDRVVSEVEFDGGKIVTFPHGEHVRLFGLECGDCHTRESCIRCHDVRREATPASRGESHEGCQGCHAVDEKCERCHGDRPKPGFDHTARAGWALGRFHESLSCGRCHTEPRSFAGLSGECSSCHGEWNPEIFHHRVTGLTLDANHAELPCEVCHSDVLYREGPNCEQCHDAYTYPAKSPGTRARNLNR